MFGSSEKKVADGGATVVEPPYGADAEKGAVRMYGGDEMHVGGMTGANALNDRGEIDGGVKRQLKPRHMAMIAIGGSIGTGESARFALPSHRHPFFQHTHFRLTFSLHCPTPGEHPGTFTNSQVSSSEVEKRSAMEAPSASGSRTASWAPWCMA